MIRRLLAMLAAALLPSWAMAASNTSSVAAANPRAAFPAQLRAAPGSVPATRVRLPAPAASVLEKVREANDAPGPKRLQVGTGRPLDAHPEARGERLQWQKIAAGWVGHWEVTSEGAASLRVAVDASGLPAAAELRFTDAAGTTVYGPFGAAETLAGAPYWSPVIEGDTARVEVFLPQHAHPAQARIRLEALSHLYVSVPTGKFGTVFNHSGACQEDLICRTGSNQDPALAEIGRSVAGMTFVQNGASYLCSGTLLNPTGTQVPYFYSAAHCISTQAVASTLTTHWFFDRTSCGTGGTVDGYVQLPGGAQLLYANADSDALLLELEAAPPAGAVYAGWDATALAGGADIVGIHHPGGDWKKVSRGDFNGFLPPGTLQEGYPQGSLSIVNWMSGVTEPGSSGSGLFSFDGASGKYKLRGGLWGGGSSCQNPGFDDLYSRFDQVYPKIAQWLDPPVTSPCTFTLSRTGISVSAAAESGNITVTPSAASCSWRASSGVSWVTLSGPGTGSSAATGVQTVNYSIAANNSTAARNGSITLAGASVAVEQAAATLPPSNPSCSYTLSPALRSIGASANSGAVNVETDPGCPWIPVSNVTWLETRGSGSSAGSFTYTVQANTGAAARSATVVVGDKTFNLLQGAPGEQPPEPPGVPELTVLTPGVAFGGQSMGTTSGVREVLVTNSGGGTLSISVIARSTPQFGFSSNCISLFNGETCLILVNMTPAVAPGPLNSTAPVNGTLSIGSNAPDSPHAVTLSGTAEKSLVTHFYRAILRREPDAGGKSFWQAEAERVAAAGANVNETWYAMAMGFFSSPEYLSFARPDAAFATDLYNTFFNRAPDSGGLAYWTGLLAQGMPREVVLAGFMFSPEFTGFTTGIFGNTAARAEVDTAGDFYRGLLARLPDSAGLAYWVQRFRTAQCSGAAAVYAEVEAISSGFANSPEYGARNRSNAQFVGDMYNAFLRRGADLTGVQYWIGQLDSGARTRDNVRQAFISTPEFGARVQAVIAQGCLT